MFRAIPLILVAAFVLAACGGPASLPAPPPPPVTPRTLYVGVSDRVFAYDANASGFTTPQRTITGLSGPIYRAAFRLATRSNGELWVLQVGGLGPMVGLCQVIVESPTADGTSGVLRTVDCGAPLASTIARGAGDGMDILVKFHLDKAYHVNRIGSAAGDFQAPASEPPFATDAAGNMYFGVRDRIDEFAASAPTGAAPIRSMSFAGRTVEALAIASDGRSYAVTLDPGSGTRYIDVVAPGASSPYQTMGPIPGVQSVSGLATDSGGSLYVALQGLLGVTEVNVYAPDADGRVTVVRSMELGLPVGAPLLDSVAVSP